MVVHGAFQAGSWRAFQWTGMSWSLATSWAWMMETEVHHLELPREPTQVGCLKKSSTTYLGDS